MKFDLVFSFISELDNEFFKRASTEFLFILPERYETGSISDGMTKRAPNSTKDKPTYTERAMKSFAISLVAL